MIKLEDAQKRMADLKCPTCKKSNFAIMPRPTVSFGEDLYTARCLDCPYTFQVSIPTKPISQTQPDTVQWLSGIPCPKCGELGVTYEFRCSPSVREVFYFVTCKDCRHPFHEKAFMEAFE